MIAGRSFTPEYVIGALNRRKIWIIPPFVLGLAVAVAVSLTLQNTYQSHTVILVVPQRVPEAYVRSTVTQPIESRLRTISEQIRSRSRLERIIAEFNLYGDALKEKPMEVVVERMKASINVAQGRGDSFALAFTYTEPELAAKVTNRLASMFIEENLRDRETQSEDTSQFLEIELEEARQRLVEHETKLEEYRKRYAGQLPTQVASNLQVIQTTQQQIQALAEASNRYRDQRNNLQRQIADLEATPPAPPPLLPLPQPNQQGQDPMAAGGTAAQQLEAARRSLTSLRGRLTSDHPDVRRLEGRIAELEIKAKDEAASAPTAAASGISPAEALHQNRLRNFKDQISVLDRQIAQNEVNEGKLRERINEVQARIDASPSRESELTELTRDYGTLYASYQALLAKKEDSRRATSLERRQRGQQFQVLDAARVPERPFSPNRPVIVAMGAAAGLAFGLLLGAFLELRDSSLRTQDEVIQLLDLPVLAMIPLMMTSVDFRRRRRVRMIAVLATFLITVGAGAVWWLIAGPGASR